MRFTKKGICIALYALAVASSPALAHKPIEGRTVAEEKSAFDTDRADILAMAGNFKVKFDMQESTRWDSTYTPLEKKISGGNEVVRVIEDTGRKIVLQHMLVINHEGKDMIIKHWRQDWEYEPAEVLVYSDTNEWTFEDVPEKMRAGRWSQTVWQVDDSPRYGSWGQFEEQAGVRRWRSGWTWRPLARRDAVRKPVYDRYLSINRHSVSPDGWIHWQDNTKLGTKDGKLKPIVQEYLLNSYTKSDDYNFKSADDYWAKTKGYWQAIRAEWSKVAATKGGIGIQEEAETGTIISARLLEMADEIVDGRLKEANAIGEGIKLIETNTKKL